MKIIITESQKEKLLNDFMKSLVDETLDENKPSYVDSYIVIWDKGADELSNDATAIEYDYFDGRLWVSKKYLNDLIENEDPDIFCMGETKISCPYEDVENEMITNDLPPFVTVKEASTISGKTLRSIQRLCKDNLIHYLFDLILKHHHH